MQEGYGTSPNRSSRLRRRNSPGPVDIIYAGNEIPLTADFDSSGENSGTVSSSLNGAVVLVAAEDSPVDAPTDLEEEDTVSVRYRRGSLLRTRKLLLAALRVWELKHRNG